MATYRIRSGDHYKDGERYQPGDVLELTDDEVAGLEFKFEEAPDAEPTTTTEESDAPAEDSEPEFNTEGFLDRNVGPIEESIEAGEADGYIDVVADAERAEKNRSTVLEALAERKAEL